MTSSAKKEETKTLKENPAFSRRMSTMDALKEQIMLRKQAMNPNLGKQEQENPGDIAKKAMLASKFNNDSFDEVDEESDESSDAD